MKENNIVIMAGGVGSRLFPLSTPERPKQFLDLLDSGKTMIELTYERYLKCDPDAKIWVVTSKDYIHFVHELLPAIPDERILAEPVARNTAPAVAYACWKIRKANQDCNIIVTPADSYIPDTDGFKASFNQAVEFIEDKRGVVCLGLRPTAPNTTYGYIQAPAASDVVKVGSFTEKPDLDTAKKFIEEGCYFWNLGIFFWNGAVLEREIRTHMNGTAQLMDELKPYLYTVTEGAVLERVFPLCEKISTDYAVMEKTDRAFMLQVRWGWSDLGCFEAIENIKNKK
ncbi:MAG: mannose-1-phosphate guanylyltransferase [Bacteroidales bacterium]|nr:mannose-1-phosphate guanylyltransferase [Bacteroidales bacterium]